LAQLKFLREYKPHLKTSQGSSFVTIWDFGAGRQFAKKIELSFTEFEVPTEKFNSNLCGCISAIHQIKLIKFNRVEGSD